MNKTITFAKRNFLEMSRDPLSYIFCVALPLVMMVIMTLVNESVPKNMTIFQIDNLTGGVVIFGQTFVMLFTALSVATDRGGSFLTRLFASPMKGSNFTGGYILPMLLIAEVQIVLDLVCAYVISLITGNTLSIPGMLLLMVTGLPSAVMFTAVGIIFGTLFNEKSAPGLCSVIISLGSFIGGIWFDAEQTGGVLYKICKCTPFLYCTKAARATLKMDFTWDAFFLPMIIVVLSAVALMVLAVFLFKRKMKADLA